MEIDLKPGTQQGDRREETPLMEPWTVIRFINEEYRKRRCEDCSIAIEKLRRYLGFMSFEYVF
jgi:hypothetical protein